ncbi:MAG: sulfotransferase [Calditrichaeota bacterium]|nr:MAG: sulfotransferase [Calditrichota bacterium]MBL1204609.1 sulfotransferase [Calditrichota bacterium]NOG44438.1 sulfotransferase [Calditrichota bacterium]
MLPNFLVIGAAKAGTTSLYNYLKQHPDIYLSPEKEPDFFSFYNRTPFFKGPHDKAINDHIINKLEDYQELFKGAQNKKAIGECSNSYLYFYERTIPTITEFIPNCKIIAVLRNPIDRAFSQYTQSVMIGIEDQQFTKSLELEKKRLELGWRWHYDYSGQSKYFEQIKAYIEAFSKNNVKIYFFEDLINKPLDVLYDIFKFLEVDPNFTPDVSKKFNKSGIVRSKTIQKFVLTDNIIKRLTRSITPSKLRAFINEYIMNKNIKKYSMPIEIRYDIKRHFEKDISQLQSLVDKDLESWFK